MMHHIDYVRDLKPLLPKAAFRANPKKAFVAAFHLCVIFAGWALFRTVPSIGWPVLSLVLGHSLACLGFFAHELTHGMVLSSRRGRYSLELMAWGLNLISPTMWRKLHNEAHHRRTNARNDPDRRFVHSEDTLSTRAYSLVFFPNKRLGLNLLPFLHFVTYILRHSISVLYKDGRRPEVTTFRPAYTDVDKTWIAAEWLWIAAVQVGTYLAVGSMVAWIWAGPVSLIMASAMLQVYLFTNHFLNPLGDGADPLAATTSVQVPRFIDALHFNFSYHTEHHLFPGMDSKYYPLLSALLQERFPKQYHRVSIKEAWSRLLRMDLFVNAAWDKQPATRLKDGDLTGSHVIHPV